MRQVQVRNLSQGQSFPSKNVNSPIFRNPNMLQTPDLSQFLLLACTSILSKPYPFNIIVMLLKYMCVDRFTPSIPDISDQLFTGLKA